MKLHTFPPSPNSIKVVAVANMLGMPLEIQMVDLLKGESKTPEYMKMNPNGKIPMLQDGDFLLWESSAIIQYLAHKAGNEQLWPSDPKAQADVSRWMCWSLAHWSPAIGTLLFERMVKGMMRQEAPDPKEEAKGTELFMQYGAVLDAHMADRKWLCGGDHPTLADFAVATPLFYAMQARLPWESFKHMQAYWQRFSALDCVQKAMPQMPAGAAS